MSGEIVKEWYFWLVSIAAGAFMAFVYDVLRLFRRLVRHGRFAVDLEDILYWTACFGLSFTLLYYGNNGVIRFAAVLGAALGMFGYAVTAGRFFVRFSFWVIDKTVGALFRLIGKIMRRIGRIRKPIQCFVHKWYCRRKCHFNRTLQKLQLTCTSNRHKIKVSRHRQIVRANRAEDRKGEVTDVGKGGSKKSKQTKTGRKNRTEDAGISPRQK